jgi:hypothetical protein
MKPRYLAPVLSTFVQALPHTFQDITRPNGTLIGLTISGAAGGCWYLLRNQGQWVLQERHAGKPHAQVIIPQDDAWRLFTKGLDQDDVLPRVTIVGDEVLGHAVLDTVSIIA